MCEEKWVTQQGTSNQKIILGQETIISAKIIIIQRTWHSKITLFQQYEYIDEMLEGPFMKWKHTHKFKRINKNKTEIIDEVEFSLPYGAFGKIVSIYVTKILRKLFKYRENETIKYFSSRWTFKLLILRFYNKKSMDIIIL